MNDISPRQFYLALAAISLLFVGLEAAYIVRFPLIMDEYVNANIVDSLRHGIAYRDVISGKTVLGFYSQLPVLAIVADAWNAMLAVKFEMVLMALAAVLFAAVVLAEEYSRGAVVVAVALLFAMNTFNERIAEFRSDTPTTVFGLVGLILLLRRRWALAGLACAISLMMSQKAAYYVLGSEAALGAVLLIRRDRESLRAGFAFNTALGAGFAAYIGFFSIFAGLKRVLELTFIGPAPIAFQTIYAPNMRAQYWTQTVIRNPVFYALALIAIFYLIAKALKRDERAAMLGAYAIVVTALCAWHKQPWPYFFVILIPTLFVAQVPLIDAWRTRWKIVLPIAAVLLMVVRLPITLARDSSYQESMFRLGSHILRDGGTYFAGVPVYYSHPQALAEQFNTLDAYWLGYLWNLKPAGQIEIIKRLDAQPVRFLLYNYRLARMPQLFRTYFRAQFDHYWGAVFLYAPLVQPGAFTLHVDGKYAIDSRGHAVTIDSHPLADGGQIQLTRGTHQLRSDGLVRRRLVPPPGAPLDTGARDLRELFPDMYEF